MGITIKVGAWLNDFTKGKFAACMSTGITGAVGSYLPDGDIYAFLAQDIMNMDKSGDKNQSGSGHIATKYPSGKITIKVQLTNCTLGTEVIETVSTDATDQLNTLIAFIDTHGIAFGSDRVYFWVKNMANNKYINLTTNGGGTRIRPIYGYPLPINWQSKASKSGVYFFNFVFEEVTIG